MAIDIGWEALQWPGLEHLVLAAGAGGCTARSQLVLDLDRQGLASVSYDLACGPGWRFAELAISVSSASAPAWLRLTADADGQWLADGQPRPDLAGCTDIDINCTPLTNTLPIRRLDWPAGTAHDIDVAYVTVPGLEVHRARQRYTLLAGDGRADSTFRYESGSFRTELPVDGDGLVIDYPGIWRRISGAEAVTS
jgi:uncharacterized protein